MTKPVGPIYSTTNQPTKVKYIVDLQNHIAICIPVRPTRKTPISVLMWVSHISRSDGGVGQRLTVLAFVSSPVALEMASTIYPTIF